MAAVSKACEKILADFNEIIKVLSDNNYVLPQRINPAYYFESTAIASAVCTMAGECDLKTLADLHKQVIKRW